MQKDHLRLAINHLFLIVAKIFNVSFDEHIKFVKLIQLVPQLLLRIFLFDLLMEDAISVNLSF